MFLASCRRQPCVPGRFSGHCDLAWSLPALRPLMLLSAMRLILKWFSSPRSGHCDLACPSQALRPGTVFAGIASADAFRRLASNQLASLPPAIFRRITSCRRQPCVPGRFSGHCDLAWSSPALRPLMLLSAMRPTEGSITSRRSRPRLLPKAASLLDDGIILLIGCKLIRFEMIHPKYCRTDNLTK